jgi:hypothetical protein
MRFRKLRIAWSVGWGILAVLLIVLWVRSYWYKDTLIANLFGRNFQANSELVRLSLATMDRPIGKEMWYAQSKPIGDVTAPPTPSSRSPRRSSTTSPTNKQPPIRSFSTTVVNTPSLNVYGVGMPYWAWLLLPAIAAGIPWMGRLRRFSLRTLLIAATLVAVILGLVVYAAS